MASKLRFSSPSREKRNSSPAREDTVDAKTEQQQQHSHEKKSVMAQCFDFRMRTTSFDLHTLAAGRSKLAKLTKLFRSKSNEEMKSSSPSTSPKDSPRGAAPRRRFVRVVRNAESEGEEYENPHLVRRYTREYWEEQQQQIQTSVDYDPTSLPYKVSGHTILKHSSFDSDSSPPVTKHACFKDDIEVIEFDKKSKIKKNMFFKHKERLVDSSGEDTDSDTEFAKRREEVKGKKPPPMDYSSEEDDVNNVAEAVAEITVCDAPKEDLVLSLASGVTGFNGICSPVEEEDESHSVTDSESEASEVFAANGKSRHLSIDSSISVEISSESEMDRKMEVES